MCPIIEGVHLQSLSLEMRKEALPSSQFTEMLIKIRYDIRLNVEVEKRCKVWKNTRTMQI